MLLEFAEVPDAVPLGLDISSLDMVSPAGVGVQWPSEVPIRAVKTLRGRVEDAGRPKLDDGHLMMNWEVTGSRYLHRRREESEMGVGCQTQRQD